MLAAWMPIATKAHVACNHVSGLPVLRRSSKETYNKPVEHVRDGYGRVKGGTPSFRRSIASQKGNCVSKSLKDDDTPQPSMDQVICVEGDAEQENEGAIPASQNEKWDHVHDRENTRAVSDEFRDLCIWQREVNGDNTEGDVGGKVGKEEGELKACRQGSDIDGRTELELAIVTFAEDGCVEHILLEPRDLW